MKAFEELKEATKKRHQHQSKAYMTYEEAVHAEKDYINKYKDIEINPHITF